MSAITGQLVLEPDGDGWFEQARDPSFGSGTQCAGQPVQAGPLWAAYGVASALWQRSRTGQGCYIDVSDCDATLASAWIGLPDALNPGAIRIEKTSQSMALHSARHAFYETKDGKHVFVAMIEPKFWARFCRSGARTCSRASTRTSARSTPLTRSAMPSTSASCRRCSALVPATSGQRSSWRMICPAHR